MQCLNLSNIISRGNCLASFAPSDSATAIILPVAACAIAAYILAKIIFD